LVPLG